MNFFKLLKHIFYFLFFCINSFTSFSQKTIELKTKEGFPVTRRMFYIDSVIDNRYYKDDIGYFNSNKYYYPEKELSIWLQEFYDLKIPQKESKKPITLIINHFEIKPYYNSNTQVTSTIFSFSADVCVKNMSNLYFIKRIEKTSASNTEKSIRIAMFKALSDLWKTKLDYDNELKKYDFNSFKNINYDISLDKNGTFYSSNHLKHNNIQFKSFKVDSTEKYFSPYDTSFAELEDYACVYDGKLYLRKSIYNEKKGFEEALTIGRYIVVNDKISFYSAGNMGITGVLIDEAVNSMKNKTELVIIDLQDGYFDNLNSETLKRILLINNTDLLSEYLKESDRNESEIMICYIEKINFKSN